MMIVFMRRLIRLMVVFWLVFFVLSFVKLLCLVKCMLSVVLFVLVVMLYNVCKVLFILRVVILFYGLSSGLYNFRKKVVLLKRLVKKWKCFVLGLICRLNWCVKMIVVM